jgi:Holliday junction DNA helicase RuvA
LDVGGVGYEIYVGKNPRLPKPGEDGLVTFWIHTYVREDQFSLYGFPSLEQRAVFRKLTTVTGVGPKLALAVISTLDARAVVEAVNRSDLRTLSSVSGVGKRVAERIALELKGKLDDLALLVGAGDSGFPVTAIAVWQELAAALEGLGFPETRIRTVLRWLQDEPDTAQADLQTLLKRALQKINSC